jgi:hypothetical protein
MCFNYTLDTEKDQQWLRHVYLLVQNQGLFPSDITVSNSEQK